MPDMQRLRVLHPINHVGTAAVHLDRERPIGTAAAVFVKGAEPTRQLVADEQQAARKGGCKGAEALGRGIGDPDAWANGRRGLLGMAGIRGGLPPAFTAALTSTFQASRRASAACL